MVLVNLGDQPPEVVGQEEIDPLDDLGVLSEIDHGAHAQGVLVREVPLCPGPTAMCLGDTNPGGAREVAIDFDAIDLVIATAPLGGENARVLP